MQNNNNCKNSIVIVLCLSIIILLGFSNAETEFIPSTAEELKYQRMVTFYYDTNGESCYDEQYCTLIVRNINRYCTVWFHQYYWEPAASVVFNKQKEVIDVIPFAGYGTIIKYDVPQNANYIVISCVRDMMESVRPAAITAAQKTPAPTKEITPAPTVEKTPTPTPTETPAPTVEKKQSASQEKRKTEANDDLPLDRVITDGGFSRIFRTIGVVGDSLSSGAMTYNIADEEAKQKNATMYEYSWIQYMARYCGSTAYNFSFSGMSTDSFFNADWCKPALDMLTDGEHLCQAYFIALGHNDYNHNLAIGSLDDVDLENWDNNANTYIGNYARIISTIKNVQPTAKIFPILMKNEKTYGEYNDAIRQVVTLFPENVYLLEMDKYAEKRQSWEVTLGHGNAIGYLNYSYQVSSYVDWYIRHYPDEFAYVQFIGTDYEYYLGFRTRPE